MFTGWIPLQRLEACDSARAHGHQSGDVFDAKPLDAQRPSSDDDDWSTNIDDVDRNEFRRQCALELSGVDADKSRDGGKGCAVFEARACIRELGFGDGYGRQRARRLPSRQDGQGEEPPSNTALPTESVVRFIVADDTG